MDYILELYKKYKEDNISFLAGGIAYFALFSLIPLLMFASSIAGYLSVSSGFKRMLLNNMLTLFPVFERGFLLRNLDLIVEARASSGFVAVILSIYAGSNVFRAIENSLAIIFSIKASSLIISRTKAFMMVFLTGWLIIISTSAGLLVNVFSSPGFIYESLLFVLEFLVSYLAFFITYRFIAGVSMELRHLQIGAFVAVLFLEIFKALFSYYLTIANFNSTFGLISTTLILLLWIYASVIIFLLGAELVKIIQEK